MGITGAEDVEWHQCPEAVRNYLANVTYNPDDYSASEIATYAPATAVVSNYKPIGKTVGSITYFNEVPNVLTPFAGSGDTVTITSSVEHFIRVSLACADTSAVIATINEPIP